MSLFIRTIAGNLKPVSVPSFGDSFFIKAVAVINGSEIKLVSVPSFGDSFFIREDKMESLNLVLFPSPHSGILFL